ncbi:translocation/assembly module TamB domain-containing protein [Thiobaca trueperi]|uniref:Autotransporter secretion inner membrane protein TamB n=1 Tax=Thiobaca trueperi TaxID=127458 RepID=A0A4R3MYF3_9GAMM|nr:translocation/assembly module TamB domain-containing protein [Thiobaca trueperi]TCT19793.1 autotransporter secretion inner membrane protein TamB [Thiobaca trueperi]
MRRFLLPLSIILLTPVLLLALLLLAVNTEPGRGFLVARLESLTGGQVVLSGLSGTLPTAPRLARLELRDEAGVWLLVEDAVLDLDLWQLPRGKIAVEALTARAVVLSRLPEANDDEPSGPIRLPMQVLLQHLAIADLSLEQALPGAPRLTVEGSGDALSIDRSRGALRVAAIGRADRYSLEWGIDAGRYDLKLGLEEASGGLLARLAEPLGLRVPADLDGWRFDARAEGPSTALALDARLEAGPLQAAAEGVLDLNTSSTSGLRLSAEVPAMALTAQDLGWRRIALKADVRGTLDAPQGNARLELDGLAFGDYGLDRLTATAEGDAARLTLDAALQGLRAPLDLPAAVTTDPLHITGELSPQDAALPFQLSAKHPLLDLAAEGRLAERTGRATLNLPDLAAFATLIGAKLAGSARFEVAGAAGDSPHLDASGDLKLTQAPGPLVALLGASAPLALKVRQDGDVWQLDSARIKGAKLKVAAQGQLAGETLTLGWALDLSDLGALGPGWSGRLQALGGLSGSLDAPELVAELETDANLGEAGRGRLAGRLAARLAPAEVALTLNGDWAGQPVAIDLQAGRTTDGALTLSFGDSRWASVAASGSLRLPHGATLPQGEIRLNAPRLADLNPLLAILSPPTGGQPAPTVAGRLDARLALTDAGQALIEADGKGLTLPGAVGIESLMLTAQVKSPLGAATTDATLRLRGLAAGEIGGDLSLTARGTANALDLTADARLTSPAGPLVLTTSARLDAPASRLAVQRLETSARGETLRLLAPSTLNFADGLAVDRLRLGLRKGTLDLAGRLMPRLDLNATLAGLPLDLVQLAAPDVPLTGTLGAQIRLAGALDAPTGSLRVQATELRLNEGAARSLPATQIQISADLGERGTDLDARLATGKGASLQVRGRIDGRLPFAPGALALRADGQVDLGLLDPLLTSGGRQISGRAVLDTRIVGTLAAPRLNGTLQLSDATLRDRTIGLALTGMTGTLRLADDTLRVERLTARAGPGSLTLDGSVGVLAPGLPVDLRLVASEARPVQSDIASVKGNADLTLRGRARERLDLAGNVRLDEVDIRLPEHLPANIATLEVRERGTADHPNPPTPRTQTSAPLDLGLDLSVSAPRRIYLRGRGVDAELGGEVQVRGTAANPNLSGGFKLLRGEYELVGQTLNFSRGRIGFDGATGIDPTLDLEARVTTADSTAILAVLGTASAPRIELRGEPELPQDEVLSRLLFGVAGGRLSPLQAARLGMAAASLAGIGKGGGFGVLDRARTGLGLDRLSVGTDEQGGATVEGGRYLSERVYLGARQSARTNETQGVVRIELTPNIRLEADVGATGGTRAGAAYEREY